jgi:hypothetical protein
MNEHASGSRKPRVSDFALCIQLPCRSIIGAVIVGTNAFYGLPSLLRSGDAHCNEKCGAAISGTMGSGAAPHLLELYSPLAPDACPSTELVLTATLGFGPREYPIGLR